MTPVPDGRPTTASVHDEEAERHPPPLPVDSVAVVGLGLMGGSLVRALKALDPAPRVVGMTENAADAESARETRAVDEILAAPEGLADVDLVVYAVPLQAFMDLLPSHAPHLEGKTVTDVASLKAPVLEVVRKQGLDDGFVGGHPMTGGEGSGFGASRSTLFRGAHIHLMQDSGSEDVQRRVETFWRALDARPGWTDAEQHDRRVVWASHLPQLVANALAGALAGADIEPEDLGPGGRDMTRLAASSAAMWRDLLNHAAPKDAAALRVMADELEGIANDLDAGRFRRIEELMETTRSWRRGGRSG